MDQDPEEPTSSSTYLQESAISKLICRLCANVSVKVIGIYSEEGHKNELATKMNAYLPIKVGENDTLPLQCCWNCASTVLAWHELVSVCVEAEKRLLDPIKIETKFEIMEAKLETENSYDYTSEQKNNINEAGISENEVDLCENEADICDNDDNDFYEIPSSYEETITTPPKEEENEKNIAISDDECSLKFDSETSVTFENEKKPKKQLKKQENENSLTFTNEKQVNNAKKSYKLDQEAVNSAKIVIDGRVYYNCKICSKSLYSPYTYVWHMRIHTGERPYVCDLCGKQFRVSQGLVRHLKETHEGIKKFTCDLCGRKFATKRNVEEHRRIHTNERPYVCDLCGKSFKQKASLFVHNRSHTDFFPFSCNYCNQGFRTKPTLLLHVTRHTGEKPYACDVCGRCFRIKYELKRHKLIHSDLKPFKCEECGLKFRQKRYLRNHNKSNHHS